MCEEKENRKKGEGYRNKYSSLKKYTFVLCPFEKLPLSLPVQKYSNYGQI